VKRIVKLLVITIAFAVQVTHAQPTSKPPELSGRWGDQGDGTFVNPVLPADYSDIDAIRVGDDYYAISSTLHLSPGMAVLHSRDLVNWELIGHAVQDVTQISLEMNWDRMNRYGRGVWAGAIRHHDGKFWLYFASPDEGLFMTTATNPAGPWEPLHQLWKVSGWDDLCPFWDDDGQAYLVATNFARDPANGQSYNIHLLKMSADGKSLVMESDRIIHQSRGSEANKLYKFNGSYYHFFSEVRPEGRVTMMGRARTLEGPWETRQLNHVSKNIDKEPNQGGLLQVAPDNWWFLTHQGSGDWDGRTLALLPVAWTDGWPIIGAPGADGIGNMVWSAKKPIASVVAKPSRKLDDFDLPALGAEWEWNHQPRADHWSLTQRPGFLRLHAFKPLDPGNFMRAGNTLSQRVLRTRKSAVTALIDISKMTDGQTAGMCHFSRSYVTCGVAQSGTVRKLVFNMNGQKTEGPEITGGRIWLRSHWDIDGKSQYAYSLDGQTFTTAGPEFQLTWGYYRGDRVGIFTFNDLSDSGEIDVDSFDYTFDAGR
jgi:beta-xylosidase